MILILGQTEDDILYFRSRFTGGEKTEMVPGNIKAYIGSFGVEDIVIAATGLGNIPAAVATSTLIDRYDPYLVVNVGSAIALSPSLHQGDLVLAERYYMKEVDFSLMTGDHYGQFPGKMPYITFLNETTNNAREAAYEVCSKNVSRGYIISGDDISIDKDGFDRLIREHYASTKNLISAYDASSFGIAYSTMSRSVSLLTIRVIGAELGRPETLLTYKRAALESMSDVGAILAQLLIAKQNQFTAGKEDME